MTAKAVLSWAVQELCWAVYTSAEPAGNKPTTQLHVPLIFLGKHADVCR